MKKDQKKKSAETHAVEDWAKKTALFRDWDETKREVLLHKWYESEKAGHDVGWDRAYVDWLIRHGKKPHDKRLQK